MRILVFQHADVEHPGVFLDFWREAGHGWTAVAWDAGETPPALEGFDLLVAMGGPMDVWQEDQHPWLRAEKAAIREWVIGLGRPFLGVCLGHQLLADALGGRVGPMARPEVGLATVDLTPTGQADPLLAGFSPWLETFQWHGAEISRLPEGAEILASNAACPIQMFRARDRAYGIQFHSEITASTVEEWARLPAYKSSLEQALGPRQSALLPEIVSARLPEFRGTARRLNDNLMSLLA